MECILPTHAGTSSPRERPAYSETSHDSLNNHSSAGHTAAYLKLPIVLTNAAWLRLVYLANPARVDEMGTRLASVVQTAWQELSLQPTAKHIQFHLYHKEEEGRTARSRCWSSR